MRPPMDNPWAAMFMEEPRWQYEGFGDTGGSTSTADTLGMGSLIQDQVGNVWKAVRLAPNLPPMLELMSGDRAGLRVPYGDLINQIGRYFLTETGRGIQLSSDGTFRALAQYETANLFGGGGTSGGGGGGGGGGGSAPAYSSTRQAAQETMAFEREQLLAQADLAEKAAQNEFNRTLKLQKIQEAADLRARALAMENDLRVESLRRQQAAESQLVELAGRDPFRFGAARMGQRAPTQTPVDIFRGQLQQTATSPVPQFNPNATMDEITNNIRSMEQFTTQQPYRPPGLERGGKIGQKGAVEPFKFGRPDPHTMLEMADKMGMTPIITGERAGGPELMLAPKGTTVIPLTDEEEEEFVGSVPGAQFGGTVSNAQRVASGFGQQIGGGVFRGIGNEFMPSEFAGGVRLGRLFRATRDALARRGVGGAGGWKDVGHAVRETLRTPGFAGFNPSNTSLALLQGALERESGAAEGLSQFAPLQFLRRQAGATGLMERGLTDAPLNTRRFREIAPSFGFLPPPAAGAAYRTPTPQDAYTGAIYSPITGVLPSPHKIAFSFKQLDPSAQASVLSAYALAGVPEEAFLQQVNSAGIRGSARTGISA